MINRVYLYCPNSTNIASKASVLNEYMSAGRRVAVLSTLSPYFGNAHDYPTDGEYMWLEFQTSKITW